MTKNNWLDVLFLAPSILIMLAIEIPALYFMRIHLQGMPLVGVSLVFSGALLYAACHLTARFGDWWIRRCHGYFKL